MDYESLFLAKLDALRQTGQYRTFTSLKRRAGRFPYAVHGAAATTSEVVIWCTNDYLGMGQHPAVVEATHRAIDAVGIGSGGSRNISGTSPYTTKNWRASLPTCIIARRHFCSCPVTLQTTRPSPH